MDELANVGGRAINGGFLEMELDQPWDNELNAPIVSALCQNLSNINHLIRVSQLLKFFERIWWRPMWVLQEVAVAKKVYFCTWTHADGMGDRLCWMAQP